MKMYIFVKMAQHLSFKNAVRTQHGGCECSGSFSFTLRLSTGATRVPRQRVGFTYSAALVGQLKFMLNTIKSC